MGLQTLNSLQSFFAELVKFTAFSWGWPEVHADLAAQLTVLLSPAVLTSAVA